MRLEIVLHDRAPWREHLLPMAFTRPVGAFRVGILTIQEKWQSIWNVPVSFYTEPYLQEKFKGPSSTAPCLVVRANLCPTADLVDALFDLEEDSVLEKDGEWIAYRIGTWSAEPRSDALIIHSYTGELQRIQFLEDIYLHNAEQIVFDFNLLTNGKTSAKLHASNTIIGDALFVGKNVQAFACTFNALSGPIYIGDDVVLEQGSHLKGPIAIGKGARVKMGSCLYPNVSIGPYATIGGEINNSVMWENSAKGHAGYLGCAVIGEGCNLGAGTSNSNLQNNWQAIKLYDYKLDNWRETGRNKVGVFMGDFAMCGINSSITTGAVIGVGAQLSLSNIIPKFVGDFSWITDQKQERYVWRKFEDMLKMRGDLTNKPLYEVDLRILQEVYSRCTQEEFSK
ncbi:putative sugar nucleotidyl transferase [Sphingobacterium sp. FBM7-1]|uniref:putative sugar nucleotidyl transferase n=1 Tax=Sphingobacterium sp. FBM7-1 TaxID=2886688 RepID=UPI001D1121C9|nr:putative sugar nucleotidyl transferase [Sphingobacterium sp. FBM7-1]MCC2598550.1 transferase [Sphingobacterium sp. FBM7-1]